MIISQESYIGVKFTPNDCFGVDLMVALFGENNVVKDKDDFVFYNSDCRTKSFDSNVYRNKRAWRSSTNVMSRDGSVTLFLTLLEEDEDLSMSDSDLLYVNLSKVSHNINKLDLCFSIYDEGHTLSEIEELNLIFYKYPNKDIVFEQKINLMSTLSKFLVMGCIKRGIKGEWEYIHNPTTYSSAFAYIENIS